jgi:hypothetical protein
METAIDPSASLPGSESALVRNRVSPGAVWGMLFAPASCSVSMSVCAGILAGELAGGGELVARMADPREPDVRRSAHLAHAKKASGSGKCSVRGDAGSAGICAGSCALILSGPIGFLRRG